MLYLVGANMGGRSGNAIEDAMTYEQIELTYHFISRARVREALTQRAVMSAAISEALGRAFGGKG